MKPDWKRINKARVREGVFASRDEDGFNGAFAFYVNGLPIKCIASDGSGWRHVSVSIHNSTMTPSWSVMAQIKHIFWGEDEWVTQFHPAAGEYVNNHPGCLHLWQPTDKPMPIPRPEMVGVKGMTPEQVNAMPKSERALVWLMSNLQASHESNAPADPRQQDR